MVTPEQQIARQRESIRTARERAAAIIQKPSTRSELSRQTLESKRKRAIEGIRRKELSEKELGKISKFEKEFETGVTKYEKQKAEARAISNTARRLALGKAPDPTASKEVIKKAEKIVAPFLARQESRERAAARLKGGEQPFGYEVIRGGLGYSTLELQEGDIVTKTLGQQEFLPTPKFEQPKLDFKPTGIYEPSTETYTSPKGYKMSMAKEYIPTKTKIIESFKIDEKYKIDKPKEIYDPRTETYKTSPYGYGAGGTVIQRPPTIDEQIKIDLAQKKGSFERVVEIPKKIGKGFVALNLATFGTGGITPITETISESGIVEKSLTGYTSEEYNKLKNLRADISKGYRDIELTYRDSIRNNEFIGTEKEYENYMREQSKIDKQLEKYKSLGGSISDKGYIEMPTVNIGGGFGLRGKDVSIEKFSGLYSDTGIKQLDVVRKVGGMWDFGASTSFGIGGELFGKSIGEEKKFTFIKEKLIPEKTFTDVYKPQFGTATDYNPLTGATIKYEDLTIPARTRQEISLTGKEWGSAVGDVGTFVGKTGKYALPYAGSLFFAGEVGGSVVESGGVREYIKEHPREALLTGAVILTAGTLSGLKYLKSPIVKEFKGGFKVVSRWDEFAGKRVRFSGIDKSTRIVRDKKLVELLPSQRGVLIKRVKIKEPRIELKTAENIGENIIIETKEGIKESVLFGKQKLYEASTEGSRAIVRRFNKKTGKWEEVYSGILTTKLGREGRKEAVKLLERYGFKAKDIKSSLRYSPPKIIEQSLEKGIIKIKDAKAAGRFGYITEQPVILLDKRLGIKSRGARTLRNDYLVKRESINLKDFSVGAQLKTGIKTVVRKEPYIIDIKGLEFKGGLTFAKTKEGIGYEVSKKGMFEVVKKSPYQKISSVSVEKDIIVGEGVYVDSGKTILFEKYIGKKQGFKGRGIKSSDKYLEQLYGDVQLKTAPQLKFTQPKPSKVTTPKVELEVQQAKLDLPLMVGGTGLKTIPYSGALTYETAEVGTMIKPDVITTDLMQPVKIDTGIRTDLRTDLKTDLLLDTKLKQDFKPLIDTGIRTDLQQPIRTDIKTDMKADLFIDLKTDLKTDLRQKLDQRMKQKTEIKTPKTPTTKIPFKFKDAISRVKKIAKEKPELFKAFGIRFGKDIELGTFKTKKKAEKKLESFLKGTLGAAGFITKDKKKLKAGEIKLLEKEEFRKSKLSEFLIIEKKERRLKKGTQEVPELLFFKSKKKGLKKKKSIFGL